MLDSNFSDSLNGRRRCLGAQICKFKTHKSSISIPASWEFFGDSPMEKFLSLQKQTFVRDSQGGLLAELRYLNFKNFEVSWASTRALWVRRDTRGLPFLVPTVSCSLSVASYAHRSNYRESFWEREDPQKTAKETARDSKGLQKRLQKKFQKRPRKRARSCVTEAPAILPTATSRGNYFSIEFSCVWIMATLIF